MSVKNEFMKNTEDLRENLKKKSESLEKLEVSYKNLCDNSNKKIDSLTILLCQEQDKFKAKIKEFENEKRKLVQKERQLDGINSGDVTKKLKKMRDDCLVTIRKQKEEYQELKTKYTELNIKMEKYEKVK